MRNTALYGTLVVVVATLAQMAHGATHDGARVPLAAWQCAYVIAVVFVAPIAAAVLLWGRFRAVGAWLLLASMGGSLLFGLVYHFVVTGPDNVFTNGAGAPFAATAVLVALSAALGLTVAIRALGLSSRATPAEDTAAGLGEPK